MLSYILVFYFSFWEECELKVAVNLNINFKTSQKFYLSVFNDWQGVFLICPVGRWWKIHTCTVISHLMTIFLDFRFGLFWKCLVVILLNFVLFQIFQFFWSTLMVPNRNVGLQMSMVLKQLNTYRNVFDSELVSVE